MNQDDKIIEEKFTSLPKDLQAALSSVKVSQKIQDISERHDLLLDQSSELFDLTSDVMLGLSPAKDFVKNLSHRANIKELDATAIATDINKEVFDSIRESLQKIQENAEKEEVYIATPTPPSPLPVSAPIDHSSLEKVADMTIEKRPPSNSPLYDSSTLKREDVLRDLEDIEKLKPANANNFVEHLLSNPVSSPQQVEIKKSEVKPAPQPVQPPRKVGPDPYREQV